MGNAIKLLKGRGIWHVAELNFDQYHISLRNIHAFILKENTWPFNIQGMLLKRKLKRVVYAWL